MKGGREREREGGREGSKEGERKVEREKRGREGVSWCVEIKVYVVLKRYHFSCQVLQTTHVLFLAGNFSG